MISTSYALQQLERIMGMVGFPKSRDSGSYVAEMRKALEFARDELAAERVITDILREFKRCPAVSDILEKVATESLRNAAPEINIEPVYGCRRCRDFGYLGGDLPGHPFAGLWKWCDCSAARESRDAEPGLVDEANRVRDLLIANMAKAKEKFGTKRRHRIDPQELREDRYFGEF